MAPAGRSRYRTGDAPTTRKALRSRRELWAGRELHGVAAACGALFGEDGSGKYELRQPNNDGQHKKAALVIVAMAALDEISAAALAQLQAWLQQRPTWKHKPRLARRARRSASTPPAQQRRVFFDAAAGDDDERWGAASDGDDDGLGVEDEAKRYAASLMLPASVPINVHLGAPIGIINN